MVPVNLIHAVNSSDLERKPFYGQTTTFAFMGITTAQLNAGRYLILPTHMLRLKVLNVFLRVNTAAVDLVTTVNLSTDEATPVDIASWAQANLTSGAKFDTQVSTTVLGAGFAVALQQGAGILLKKVGTAATNAFTIDVILTLTAQ